MRITPVNINTTLRYTTRKNQHSYECSQYFVLGSKPVDIVTFGRSAKNAEVLRELMAYDIPDMYSGKIILAPKDMQKILKSHVFSGPIENIVKVLKPYEKCLHNVENDVFSIIKSAAETRPHAKLTEVIDEIAPLHYKRLRYIQTPYFEQLDLMSKQMPQEQRTMYEELMEITNKKLTNEPVCQPFSAKEFNYKLKRIADEIYDCGNPQETAIIDTMLKIAEKLPEKTEDDIFLVKNIESKVKRNKKMRTHQSLIRQRGEILKELESLYMHSVLNDNFELNRLITNTKSKVYNIPVKTSFNRKSFIYELQKITDTLDNTKLGHKMIQTALQLPTSHNDISAFIVKAAEYSSEKIGYNLIAGSEGSIDHLIPYIKKNSKECLSNYGITTKYYNSERGCKPMSRQLIEHPETYKNCQKQVNRLIELCNKGILKKIGLDKWFITGFVDKMYKLSPKETPLIIDISKLK